MGYFRGTFWTATPIRRRIRTRARIIGGEFIRWAWPHITGMASISDKSPTGRQFGSLGPGSLICFPSSTIMHPECIHIGVDTLVARDVVLSAGWHPDQTGMADRIVGIGDRCLIGRGSSIVGHRSIEIHDDVWTGQHVHITDMNHDYSDINLPISAQHQPEDPVVIGAGSWLGHGTVVLPGAQIGCHVVIGAGSVVRGVIPDYSVAVGSPARVVSYHGPGSDNAPAPSLP